MSTKERDLYTDNNFTKAFIATCTPKKWCYGYIILIYVITVCVKNVSITCWYISLLLNFNNLKHYNLLSLSKDFLQCHKSLNQLRFKVDIKLRNLMNVVKFGQVKF